MQQIHVYVLAMGLDIYAEEIYAMKYWRFTIMSTQFSFHLWTAKSFYYEMHTNINKQKVDGGNFR